MNYENYKLCKVIEAIDIVTSHMIRTKSSVEELFDKGSVVCTTFDKLMDMRNDLEKQIWLNTNPELKKEESHN